MWRPTTYTGGRLRRVPRRRSPTRGSSSVVIHAVYLINCASKEREIRAKSLASLTHALRVGDGIGADGVVLHAGARKGEPHAPVDEARRQGDRRGARPTPSTARCCSRTPPAPRGRSAATSTSSRELIDLLDGDARVGVCLDCCHLLASGFEIRDAGRAGRGGRRVRRQGRARPPALPARQRLEDPARRQPRPPREARRGRDRRARAAAFLSEPRFEELPALLETRRPGRQRPGPRRGRARQAAARRGIAARKRAGGDSRADQRELRRPPKQPSRPDSRETARCRPRPRPVTASATAAIAITSNPVNGSGPTLPPRPCRRQAGTGSPERTAGTLLI